MRTINPEPFNVYKYNELNDNAKANVKEWYLNDECWMQFRAGLT